MSHPKKHHYIPVFYLTPWVGADGRICEFSRPHRTTKAKRVHPSATGYLDSLYTIPGVPPAQADYVERRFMQMNDDWAAKAHKVLLLHDPKKRNLMVKESVGWARFLYSLILRTPEQIQRIKERMAKKGMAMPVQAFLPTLINSHNVIKEITTMSFHTAQVTDNRHPLLTSDRPIIMTSALRDVHAHIVMPISPTQIFFAVKNKATYNLIRSMDSNELVEKVNNKVAEQAVKFVYGKDDRQLRFVKNRLGKMVPSSPLG